MLLTQTTQAEQIKITTQIVYSARWMLNTF